jgi:hypothetical protein
LLERQWGARSGFADKFRDGRRVTDNGTMDAHPAGHSEAAKWRRGDHGQRTSRMLTTGRPSEHAAKRPRDEEGEWTAAEWTAWNQAQAQQPAAGAYVEPDAGECTVEQWAAWECEQATAKAAKGKTVRPPKVQDVRPKVQNLQWRRGPAAEPASAASPASPPAATSTALQATGAAAGGTESEGDQWTAEEWAVWNASHGASHGAIHGAGWSAGYSEAIKFESKGMTEDERLHVEEQLALRKWGVKLQEQQAKQAPAPAAGKTNDTVPAPPPASAPTAVLGSGDDRVAITTVRPPTAGNADYLHQLYVNNGLALQSDGVTYAAGDVAAEASAGSPTTAAEAEAAQPGQGEGEPVDTGAGADGSAVSGKGRQVEEFKEALGPLDRDTSHLDIEGGFAGLGVELSTQVEAEARPAQPGDTRWWTSDGVAKSEGEGEPVDTGTGAGGSAVSGKGRQVAEYKEALGPLDRDTSHLDLEAILEGGVAGLGLELSTELGLQPEEERPHFGDGHQAISGPRNYQHELTELAKREDVIAFLETGSGKTFIAVMLMKELTTPRALKHAIARRIDEHRRGVGRSGFQADLPALPELRQELREELRVKRQLEATERATAERGPYTRAEAFGGEEAQRERQFGNFGNAHAGPVVPVETQVRRILGEVLQRVMRRQFRWNTAWQPPRSPGDSRAVCRAYLAARKLPPEPWQVQGRADTSDGLRIDADHKMVAFLVPRVPLVFQQAEVIRINTELEVGEYCGEVSGDFWNQRSWAQEFNTKDVLVMTPQLLLNILRHGFVSLTRFGLLIFDECHHCAGRHPYNLIMQEFFWPLRPASARPRVFGMTASPVKNSALDTLGAHRDSLLQLERNLGCRVVTVGKTAQAEVERHAPKPQEAELEHQPPPMETDYRFVTTHQPHVFTRALVLRSRNLKVLDIRADAAPAAGDDDAAGPHAWRPAAGRDAAEAARPGEALRGRGRRLGFRGRRHGLSRNRQTHRRRAA